MNTYTVTHVTRYSYDRPVLLSYGRAHLIPRADAGQTCLSSELDIEPAPADRSEHTDHFGNISTYFRVDRPHTGLAVQARSTVTIHRAAEIPPHLGEQPFETFREALAAHPAAFEFVLPSPRVVGSPDLANYAHSIFRPRRDIAGCLAELASQIHADFAYRKSSTTVSSTLSDLFRQRVGVCQDFAHLAVGVLRTAGLAARYVSGYLETFPPPGQAKLMGADATHAWAEAFLPGHGWIGIDPTNNQRADDRYIVAAHGRDYDDVPPLKGVIETESRRSKMTVSVDVRRIE